MTIFSNDLLLRIKELLDYDEDLGIFTWKVSTNKKVEVGDIAGSGKQGDYIRVRIDGTLHQCHRLAWLYKYGEFPKGEIDHIDRDKSNNAIWNLRDTDRSTNAYNRDLQSNNKSGVKGVRQIADNKWRAYIGYKGKTIQLGHFECFELALEARREAEQKYRSES